MRRRIVSNKYRALPNKKVKLNHSNNTITDPDYVNRDIKIYMTIRDKNSNTNYKAPKNHSNQIRQTKLFVECNIHHNKHIRDIKGSF